MEGKPVESSTIPEQSRWRLRMRTIMMINNHYISLYIIIIDEASVMAKKGNISHFLHFFFCVAKYWSNEAVSH